MKQETALKTANIIKVIALILGIIFGVLIFTFALISGAEAYGNDFMSLLKNSPNALPWLLFLLLIWFAWKHELMGGLILMGLGFSLFFLFETFSDFQWPAFIITMIVIFNGLLFACAWWLKQSSYPD